MLSPVVNGVRAIQQVTEISAYQHARACPAGAPPGADCRQDVRGSVTAVIESAGSKHVSLGYEIDVHTASAKLHATFGLDSPMLAYAVVGDPAVVTMWRGVPVSVRIGAYSQTTTSVPASAFIHYLGHSALAAGGAAFFIAATQTRPDRKRPMRPASRAALVGSALAGIVVALGAIPLYIQPTGLGPDLEGTGAALAVVLGFSVWFGIRLKRQEDQAAASRTRARHRRR